MLNTLHPVLLDGGEEDIIYCKIHCVIQLTIPISSSIKIDYIYIHQYPSWIYIHQKILKKKLHKKNIYIYQTA